MTQNSLSNKSLLANDNNCICFCMWTYWQNKSIYYLLPLSIKIPFVFIGECDLFDLCKLWFLWILLIINKKFEAFCCLFFCSSEKVAKPLFSSVKVMGCSAVLKLCVFNVICLVFCWSLFVFLSFFFLAIVLSVQLKIMASDYPFSIVKLFWNNNFSILYQSLLFSVIYMQVTDKIYHMNTKGKFNQWWSTIPGISAKWTLNEYIKDHNIWHWKSRSWSGTDAKNVARFNRLMGYQPFLIIGSPMAKQLHV